MKSQRQIKRENMKVYIIIELLQVGLIALLLFGKF